MTDDNGTDGTIPTDQTTAQELADAIDRALFDRLDAADPVDDPTEAAHAVVDELLVEVSAPPPARFDGFVAELTVTGVRSFREPAAFGLSRGLTIVYGPNGAGKTSITDAVELFARGRTSRGTGGERDDKTHVPHRGFDGSSASPEVTVGWCDANDSAPVQRIMWSWSDPGHGVGASCPVPLRAVARRSLRTPIETGPSDRFAELGEAAGIEGVGLWTEAATILRRRAKQSRGAADEHFTVVKKLLGNAAYGLVKSADDDPQLHDRAALADHVRRSYVTGVDACADALRALPEPTAPPTAPSPDALRAAVGRLRDARAALDAIPDPGRSHLVELLQTFVKTATVDQTCPACEAGTFTPARRDEIAAVLDAERARIAAGTEVATARAAVSSAVDSTAVAVGQWVPWPSTCPAVPDAVETRFGDLGRAALSQAAATWNTAADHVVKVLRAATDDVTALEAAVGQLEGLAAQAMACDEARENETRKHTEALGAVDHDSDAARTAASVRGNEETIADAVLDHRHALRHATALTGAKSHVEARASRRVTEIVKELETPIMEWLKILQPATTPAVTLVPDDPAGNSSKQRLFFHVDNGRAHALGHLSDSQLESLGLAIQLARADRDEPGGLIVLDDPTDVLDEATSQQLTGSGFKRLIDADHQVLVLTHDSTLVKQVWANVKQYKHPVEQHFIEAPDQADGRAAAVARRDFAGILDQLECVLKDDGAQRHVANWELWRINAAGNLLRQAAEAALRELEQVKDRIEPDESAAHPSGFRPLQRRWNDIAPWVEERYDRLAGCVDPCGRRKSGLDTLLPATAALIRDGANDTSHPNATLPTVDAIRRYFEGYRAARRLFLPTDGAYADRHRTCVAARVLSHRDDCPRAAA